MLTFALTSTASALPCVVCLLPFDIGVAVRGSRIGGGFDGTMGSHISWLMRVADRIHTPSSNGSLPQALPRRSKPRSPFGGGSRPKRSAGACAVVGGDSSAAPLQAVREVTLGVVSLHAGLLTVETVWHAIQYGAPRSGIHPNGPTLGGIPRR